MRASATLSLVELRFVSSHRNRFRPDLLSLPVTPTPASGADLAAAILQVPGILNAICARAARRHHALLERVEGATRGAISRTLVLDTPRPVNFGRGRTRINRDERREDKHDQRGVDRFHGEPPARVPHPYFRTSPHRAQ